MKIGIIGGTGVCDSSFINNCEKINVTTPYGDISLIKGDRNNKTIFFLERHSSGHKLIPSKVNYKGNIYALKKLGVDFIISTAAVGGISNCKVGDFVILDQFIDFTKNRSCSFFDEEDKGVVHIDMTEPYCENIRNMLIAAFEKISSNIVSSGTYVCTEGPRFETPAEINMYKIIGGTVVGMTNVPEVVLAREIGICYATIALVTNYAAGISKVKLTHKEVSDAMLKMSFKLKEALMYLIDNTPDNYHHCTCMESLRELNSLT